MRLTSVAEMVGPELGLEAVGGLTLRAGHDAGVGDDEIERPASGDQSVGAGAHALQRRQIEFCEFEPSAFRRLRPHPLGRDLGLGEIPRGANNFSAVRSENAGGLDPEPGGDAGDQDALAAEAHAFENFVRGGGRAKCLRHGFISDVRVRFRPDSDWTPSREAACDRFAGAPRTL